VNAGYGLTETGHSSGNNEKRYKIGSVGFQPQGINMKVFI